MSNDVTQVLTVYVRVPSELGLTARELAALEKKWQADVLNAASQGAAAKIKFHITIHIEIGND